MCENSMTMLELKRANVVKGTNMGLSKETITEQLNSFNNLLSFEVIKEATELTEEEIKAIEWIKSIVVR